VESQGHGLGGNLPHGNDPRALRRDVASLQQGEAGFAQILATAGAGREA
jgi:hypothetical protein